MNQRFRRWLKSFLLIALFLPWIWLPSRTQAESNEKPNTLEQALTLAAHNNHREAITKFNEALRQAEGFSESREKTFLLGGIHHSIASSYFELDDWKSSAKHLAHSIREYVKINEAEALHWIDYDIGQMCEVCEGTKRYSKSRAQKYYGDLFDYWLPLNDTYGIVHSSVSFRATLELSEVLDLTLDPKFEKFFAPGRSNDPYTFYELSKDHSNGIRYYEAAAKFHTSRNEPDFVRVDLIRLAGNAMSSKDYAAAAGYLDRYAKS